MCVYKDINSEAPRLAAIKRRLEEDPGDAYFLDLHTRVFNRLNIVIENAPEGYFTHTVKSVERKIAKPFSYRLPFVSSIAASIILFFSAVWFFMEKQEPALLISDSDLALYYIDNQVQNLNLDEIAELAIAQDIEVESWEELYLPEADEYYLDVLDLDDIDNTFLLNTIIE